MGYDKVNSFTVRDAKMIESFIDGLEDRHWEDGRPLIPDPPYTEAYELGVKWREENSPRFEAIQVIEAWDSLPGGQDYDLQIIQSWMYVMASTIRKLRKRLGVGYPEGVTPPQDY